MSRPRFRSRCDFIFLWRHVETCYLLSKKYFSIISDLIFVIPVDGIFVVLHACGFRDVLCGVVRLLWIRRAGRGGMRRNWRGWAWGLHDRPCDACCWCCCWCCSRRPGGYWRRYCSMSSEQTTAAAAATCIIQFHNRQQYARTISSSSSSFSSSLL